MFSIKGQFWLIGLQSYSAWLSRRYAILWLGLLLLLVLAMAGLRYLYIEVDLDKLFLQDELGALKEFQAKYQVGESLGIYIESLAEPANQDNKPQQLAQQLEHLSRLSQELRQLPFVRSVRGLSTVWQQSQGDNQGDNEAQRLRNFRSFVARFPELKALHSQDWREQWLLLELSPYKDLPAPPSAQPPQLLWHSAQVSEVDWQLGQPYLPILLKKAGLQTQADLQAVLQQFPPNRREKARSRIFAELLTQLLQSYEVSGSLRLIPVGLQVNSYLLDQELSRDMIKVLVIAGILCLVFLCVLLQNRMAVLLCVLGNLLLVFGLSGWLGLPVDKIFVILPVLLGFASTISYCIHIEKTWDAVFEQTANKFPNRPTYHPNQKILYKTLARNIRPLSFAAFTTVLALLSFIAVPIPIIRIAGLQSALAVGLSYVFAFSLFSSLLLFGRRPKIGRGRNFYSGVISLALCCYRYRRASMVVAVVLFLCSLLLLPQLRVDLATESMLGRQFRYVRDLMQVSRSEIGAGGFYNIDIIFSDVSQNPLALENLERLAEFEDSLKQMDLVKEVTSVTTFIRSMQRIYQGRSDFPQEARRTEQALLTWERVFGGLTSQWYAKEAQSLRVLVQVRQGSSQENIAHMEELRRLAARIFPAKLVVRPLGGIFQLARMNQQITRGLLRSFSLSLLLVAILLFLLLRSFRIGLIALVPNLFPAILTGGIIVILGRSLDFLSMTVGPMIIGLAVDDTIYFLSYIQQLLQRERCPNYSVIDRIVRRSLYKVAPALTSTTLIFCILFASLWFSHAANIRYMGIFTVIAMLVALSSDLFLTPILLRWAFGRKSA